MGSIVFIGDSITDCDRRTDPLGLGSGYVDIVARTLRERGDLSTVVNTGIAGDRVAHLRERWQTDALDHKPSVLSIYIGVNDTLVTFFAGRPTPPDLFEEHYADVLERTAAAGPPKLVIVEPFFVGSGADWVHWREGNAFVYEDLALKRPIVRRLAERYGAAYVPLQAAFEEAVAERGATVVSADGVHPSPFGHQLIARLWLEAYAPLSTVD
jgi:lysophospholipase L1-like esterase